MIRSRDTLAGSRALSCAIVAALAASVTWAAKVEASPRVIVLDDGEKIARDEIHPLAPSVWPMEAIELFALRDETVAFQVAIEPDGDTLEHVRATVDPFSPALDARIDAFAERFVEIQRASYNERFPGSLAFTPEGAPSAGAYVGFFADALVPSAIEGAPVEIRAGPRARGALWIDIHVRPGARAGTYASLLRVQDGARILAERALSLRVVDAALPYPGAAISTFYDPAALQKRMGDRRAERSLRQMLHAHRVSAIHDILTEDDASRDEDALTGKLYTEGAGYSGPGLSVGEGILAIGAYGALGDPDPTKAAEVGRIAERLRSFNAFDATDVFVYAVDEDCKSPRGARWIELLRPVPSARGVRVGMTCSADSRKQAADLLMVSPESYALKKVEQARERGKRIWVYNGQRPYAGAMMLDVPATDLRANGWIAARYGITRWFYWESTFWFDSNRGGRGGKDGFDPFAVAETFHNASGDHANGDGVLVYPGTQVVSGMHNEGTASVLPSVRLKNIRRGAEDAGYIALARAVDSVTTDAIVDDLVAHVLDDAERRTAWPEHGSAWLAARKQLLDVIERKYTPRKPRGFRSLGCSKCSVSASASDADERFDCIPLLLVAVTVIAFGARRHPI